MVVRHYFKEKEYWVLWFHEALNYPFRGVTYWYRREKFFFELSYEHEPMFAVKVKPGILEIVKFHEGNPDRYESYSVGVSGAVNKLPFMLGTCPINKSWGEEFVGMVVYAFNPTVAIPVSKFFYELCQKILIEEMTSEKLLESSET